MTGALMVTAALMGAAGTLHCAGMCAAACGAAGRACVPGAPRRGMAVLLAARGLSYAIAGGVVGWAVQALRWWLDSSRWLQPFWTIGQVLVVGVGLWLLVRGELPPTLQQWTEGLRRPGVPRLHRVHLPGELKAASVGLLWPVLPCGLLHAALALSALASTPVEGAAVMAAFAATSSAGLIGGGWWWRWVTRRSRPSGAGGAVAVRLAGAGIVVLSLWPLMRHALLPLQAAWCG